MKLSSILYSATIAVISIINIGCEKSHRPQDEAIRNVILIEAEPTGASVSKTYMGIVEEGKSVNAAFMTGGKLQSLTVKEGDRVRKGQLLAVIDDTDYKIGVNQLQVQYDQMSAEKKRMDEMYARHNIAPNDYEKFVAGFEQLSLQLNMANNKLGYTRLYSPSDGFVSYQFMHPGELVDAGTPIYKIIDDTKLEVSVDLPLVIYLNRNDIKQAYGKAPNIKDEIPLKIESFTPDADNNQLYHMKLEIPVSYRKELTTGMDLSVVLDIQNEIEGEVLVPSRALFDDNGISYVWVYNNQDSTISKKNVTVIGTPQGSKSMIKGLSGTEKIVSAGVKQLKQGEKVNVISNPVVSK